MKKRVVATIGGLFAVSAVVLAGCAGGGGSPTASESSSGSKGTINIAAILTTTGALAENAETVYQTWQYAVDEVNAAGGAGGYTFEVERYDTDATPATSVRVATQAVTQDAATILSFQTSPENAAINPQLPGLNAISMNVIAQDDGLRGATCSANAFNIVQANSMLFNALSSDLDSLEGDKWAIMAVDYSTGHSAATAFTAAAEEAGKEIVSTQFAPLNTSDYGSYITQIQQSGADALLLVMYGADATAFVNQSDQYDLDAQLDTTLTMNVITDQSLETLGDKILDYYLIKQYDATLDNELNTKFVEGYTEEFGTAPNDYAGNTYIGAEALFAAVEEAGTDDVTAIAEALASLTFDTIAGAGVTIRPEDHQALTPTYIAQVVEGEDGLGFNIVDSIPGDESASAPNPECKL